MSQPCHNRPENKARAIMNALNNQGKNYPDTVEKFGIQGISSYDSLLKLHREGLVLIYRTLDAPSSEAAKLVMPSNFWVTMLTGYTIMFGVPVISIILAFTLSAWCVFGILFAPFGMRLIRNKFSKCLTDSALNSEIEFCLLLCGGAIKLMDKHGNPI